MRCVFYLRMSTDEQAESIPDQRRALEVHAKAKGYAIVGEYLDEGISGDATEKRVGFQKMIADCRFKRFELVLCWDQDRFGRFDPLEAGYWIKPMRDAGVALETIAQGRINWNDFAGRIVYSVQQEGKHAFLKDMARNCLRGLLTRAKSGIATGKCPFGFEKGDDGRYVPGDPSAVAAVQRAFELRLLGLGYRVIAVRLNEERAPSPSGGAWSHDSVRIILNRGETYAGTLVYGTRHRGKYITTVDGAASTQTGRVRLNPNPVKVPNAHEAIIPWDTWLRVDAMHIDPPKPYVVGGSSGAPLAGLLKCGRCGGSMYSISLARKAGQKNPIYLCGTYFMGHGCGYCYVQQHRIHQIVGETIRDRLCGGSLEEITERTKKRLSASTAESEIASLKSRIAKIENQIEEATGRILTVNARLVPNLEKRVLEMCDKRDRMVASIVGLQKSRSAISAEMMAAALWELPEIMQRLDGALVRSQLKRFIAEIRLDFQQGKKTARGQSFKLVGGELVSVSVGSYPMII